MECRPPAHQVDWRDAGADRGEIHLLPEDESPVNWTGVRSDRRSIWAFALGCSAVTAGVLMHVPMLLMGRDMGYRLAGMPMDADMLAGMALIVAGVLVAAYGLLPRNLAEQRAMSPG